MVKLPTANHIPCTNPARCRTRESLRVIHPQQSLAKRGAEAGQGLASASNYDSDIHVRDVGNVSDHYRVILRWRLHCAINPQLESTSEQAWRKIGRWKVATRPATAG